MLAIEPIWIPAEDLALLNELAVLDSGEPHFVRDRNMLEAAAARPKHLWSYASEGDIVALGVALLAALARYHPFGQGNKRTAFAGFGLFLEINGYQLSAPDNVVIAEAVNELVEGKMSEWTLTELLRPHVRKIQFR